MNIEIDLSRIQAFMNLPADQMLASMLINFGWIPMAVVFLWGAKEVWLFYIRGQWHKTQEFIFLAIDIPRGNEQSPKAVENIFTYLAGAHGSLNLIDTYWEGIFQLAFSFEIVSIEGYTQFLIHTPIKFRNLVESAIYSQYPDAEIMEVGDYTEGMPRKFPDKEYDIWGGEFIHGKHWAYPIKIYEEFVYQLGAPEEHFKDPMASLMDLCSSLGKGEQLWSQMIVIPTGYEWVEKCDEEVKKILKEKTESKPNILDHIFNAIASILETIFSSEAADKKEEKKDDVFKMFNLKPIEKKQVEAIQEKMSKLSFEFKYRIVYMAKKEVKNVPKVVNGFVGYMKQFMDLGLNNLKPDMQRTATTANYFFKEKRLNAKKNRIMNNYVKRSDWGGRLPAVMTIQELATIWHFPVESVVKAPLIQKTSTKRAQPPMSLSFSEGSDERSVFEQSESASELDNIFLEPIRENKKNNIVPEEKAKERVANNSRESVESGEIDEIFKNIPSPSSPKESHSVKGSPPPDLPFV
ncbi:MAG: hypothetical protein ABH881_02110 [bacterium]